MPSLWEELKRRKVVHVAGTYAACGWLVIEFSSVVLPVFEAPAWTLRVLTFLVLLGFPVAVGFAWAYELTSEGLKRDEEVDRSPSIPRATGRRLNLITIVVLAAAVALFAFDRFARTDGTSADRKSVAVLPFENVSRNADNEPFTIGIHDDLLAHLSKIGSIKTISRTSVLQYRDTTKSIPEIARELGVATILEGGVQRAGDRIRMNVQLVAAETDEPLWSQTYDRLLSAANVFAIQSEIATSIAEALRATLSKDEQRRLEAAPTQNLEAMNTYFFGKQLLERRNAPALFSAVEYFQNAIELDPDYALGHSGLADAYFLIPEYSTELDWREAWEKSEAAALRALEIDPELPEALTSVGWSRLIHHYDWEGAETHLRRALEVQSNHTGALHWLSHVLSWQGRHQEALHYAERAVEVDPLSWLMQMNLSYIRMDAGQFDPAIDIARVVLQRKPDYSEQLGNLWLTYLRAGRPQEAAEVLGQWANATGRDAEAAAVIGEAFVDYRETGEPQMLPDDVVSRVDFGSEDLPQIYAFVGDRRHALDALETAYEERSGSRSVLSMKLNPGYDFLRSDPRFVDLMRRAGLEP
jgi:TolB-like protein